MHWLAGSAILILTSQALVTTFKMNFAVAFRTIFSCLYHIILFTLVKYFTKGHNLACIDNEVPFP